MSAYGSCKKCGRKAEKTPSGAIHQGHNVGCENARSAPVEPAPPREVSEECAKDGCTEPRAVSKGPRPAKFCPAHKTGSK